MTRTRNYRRRKNYVKQVHAYKIFKYCWFYKGDKWRLAKYLRDNLKSCSCSACRNPRRSFSNAFKRLTIQEQRYLSIEKAEDAAA